MFKFIGKIKDHIKDIVEAERVRLERNSLKAKVETSNTDLISAKDEVIALQKRVLSMNDKSRDTYYLVKETRAELKELKDYITKRDLEKLKTDYEELKKESKEESKNVVEETKED